MTITAIQDKQIAAELAAIRKHGNSSVGRKVIFAARTRAKTALLRLGLTLEDAKDVVNNASSAAAVALALGVDIGVRR